MSVSNSPDASGKQQEDEQEDDNFRPAQIKWEGMLGRNDLCEIGIKNRGQDDRQGEGRHGIYAYFQQHLHENISITTPEIFLYGKPFCVFIR